MIDEELVKEVFVVFVDNKVESFLIGLFEEKFVVIDKWMFGKFIICDEGGGG